jgi:hypothetical protein
MFYTYLIQSQVNPSRRYVGHSADLRQRIKNHDAGRCPHTREGRPWRLRVYTVLNDAAVQNVQPLVNPAPLIVLGLASLVAATPPMTRVLASDAMVGAVLVASSVETPIEPSGAHSSRENRWREDLEYFARELPARHVQFAQIVSPKKFQRDVDRLSAAVPRLSDTEIVLELMRQVAGFDVSHTRVSWPSGALAFREYPLGFYWFSDGLAVASARPEYQEAVGTRVIRLGSRRPGQVQAALAAYVPHENKANLLGESPAFLRKVEFLQHLRIADADGHLRLALEKPDGQRFELSVAPDADPTRTNWIAIWDARAVPRKAANQSAALPYWYGYWPEDQTLYLQYNECGNMPHNPFASVVESMFAVADAQPVQRLIVDLRGNGGGDSTVVQSLLEGLTTRPSLSARRHLYALIGRGTCSSGMWAALDLERRFGALLVGEPTGGKPNSYGDLRLFELPHSRLVVRYSTKWFELRHGNSPSLMPNLPASPSLNDCLAGRDPALEAALRFPLE